jgi:hypothetical protein
MAREIFWEEKSTGVLDSSEVTVHLLGVFLQF